MTAALAVLIQRLATELEPLINSGSNWQITVHGGRGGDVKLDVLRTDVIPIDATRPQHPPGR